MKRVMLVIMMLMIPMVNAATEQETCDSLYYFVVQNNHDYNSSDLLTLEKDLNITDAKYYLDNYDFICYKSGLSDKLPLKSISPITITIKPDCNSDPPKLMRSSILDFDIPVGDIKCGTAKDLNYFFRVEQDDSYSIQGLRVWWMFGLVALGLVGYIIVEERKLNKIAYSQ